MPHRRSLILALVATAIGGCTTTYQPMAGLHRPIAIDPTVANFTDTRIELRCLKGQGLEESDVRTLCRKLTRLFENQGAQVAARTSYDPQVADAGEAEPEAPQRATRLSVELRPSVVHAEAIAPFWWDSASDFTFAQDVTIRDQTGFLLVRERLVGRFVRRLGWGGDAEERFSRDFYGQLSQLTFNARMRWTVAAAPPKTAATAPATTAGDAEKTTPFEGLEARPTGPTINTLGAPPAPQPTGPASAP